MPRAMSVDHELDLTQRNHIDGTAPFRTGYQPRLHYKSDIRRVEGWSASLLWIGIRSYGNRCSRFTVGRRSAIERWRTRERLSL